MALLSSSSERLLQHQRGVCAGGAVQWRGGWFRKADRHNADDPSGGHSRPDRDLANDLTKCDGGRSV